MEEENRVAS